MQRSTSTFRWRSAPLFGLSALLLTAVLPAQAQEVIQAQGPTDVDERADKIAAASQYLGLGQKYNSCHAVTMRDEIVLCGHRAPDPRYAPPPKLEAPDAKAIALGAPPTGHGVGVGASMRGCFLEKCPRDFYIIDLTKIPEAPPGSDADKISKGEMRGR